MYQTKSQDDTIAAIATAAGGGIGIVRISGREALRIADHIFLAKNGRKPAQFKNFTTHYGHVVGGRGEKQSGDAPEIVDEALLTVMRGPKSYTCEDIAEISCHGGPLVLKRVLSLALEAGARLAEPGEFTKRAFLNGRIDLTQAEAVLDVIQARTEEFLRVSTHQLKGELTLELEAIREQLMNVYTELEAVVNFPEDDIDAQGRRQIAGIVRAVQDRIERLLKSSHQGQILKQGIKMVLCGKPNVGKSSLLNVLLKHPRAIVSETAGTTRDTIEEMTQIRGVPFQVVDTAGILEPRDFIEEEAVKRSHLAIQGADLVLLILDASQDIAPEDKNFFEGVFNSRARGPGPGGRDVLVVINKSDRPENFSRESLRAIFPDSKVVAVSALKRSGIEELEQAILDHVWQGEAREPSGLVISNVRHVQALKNCLRRTASAQQLLNGQGLLELVADEVKRAVNELDGITGRNIDEDLLERIFAGFCIGK